MDHTSSRASATVVYRHRGHAAWLTLNRPDSLNGLTPTVIADFSAAVRHARRDEAVRCAVVTGAGRAFCTGVDLAYAKDLGLQTDRAVGEFLQPFASLVEELEAFPKPLIAAVNGTCVGGGLEIMMACDTVMAVEGSLIGDGHVVYGLLPVTGLARKLVRAVGSARARSLLLSGSLHSAAEMMSMGLINRVVAADRLVTEIDKMANTYGQRSSATLLHLKAMLREEADMSHQVAAAYELDLARQHFASGVPQRGIQAFVEGREPEFDA